MDFLTLTAITDDGQGDNDEQDQLTLTLAIACAGVEALYCEHARLCHPSRLYLTRPQLLPNPHINTPWQHLHGSWSDCAYITTMGFDVATFEAILNAGFEGSWYAIPIHQNDTNSSGRARPGA
jgi:hypothetical protein